MKLLHILSDTDKLLTWSMLQKFSHWRMLTDYSVTKSISDFDSIPMERINVSSVYSYTIPWLKTFFGVLWTDEGIL